MNSTSPPAPVLCLVISGQAHRSQRRAQNSPLRGPLRGTMGPDLRPAPDGSGLGMSGLIAIDAGEGDGLTVACHIPPDATQQRRENPGIPPSAPEGHDQYPPRGRHRLRRPHS